MLLLCSLLTACAGSPYRNYKEGKGFICTPPACGSSYSDPVVDAAFSKRLAEQRALTERHDKEYVARQELVTRRVLKNAEVIAQYQPHPTALFKLHHSYQQLIRDHMDDVLVDGPSARYKEWKYIQSTIVTRKPPSDQFSDCLTHADRIMPVFGGSHIRPKQCMPDSVDTIAPAIDVYVMINAKNKMGGYTGWTPFKCTFASPTHITTCQ